MFPEPKISFIKAYRRSWQWLKTRYGGFANWGAVFLFVAGCAAIPAADLSHSLLKPDNHSDPTAKAPSEPSDHEVTRDSQVEPNIDFARDELWPSSYDFESLSGDMQFAPLAKIEEDSLDDLWRQPARNPSFDQDALLHDMNWRERSQVHLADLGNDYVNFYARGGLVDLSAGFLIGAAIANTNLDESINHDLFRENVVDIANEDVTQKLHQPKSLGDGYVVLPLIAASALAKPWLDKSEYLSPIGEWGDRAARTVLVGGPFVLVMQSLTGGSRPNESPSSSHWEPFQDDNGVSGHAFVGAVPFLTAAYMTNRPLWKAAAFIGSVLPGLSRVNDDRHYFSQVFLGWYVAWMASRAVNETVTGNPSTHLIPIWERDQWGILWEKRY